MTIKRESLQFYLDLFNRKERNILLRDALGEASGGVNSALKISEEYIGRVTSALGIASPAEIADVGWWTDYHVDWLIGAMSLFAFPGRALDVGNYAHLGKIPKSQRFRNSSTRVEGRPLISGRVQDADLLISFDEIVILIEAKGYGSFTNSQFKAKSEKTKQIKAYYDKLVRKTGSPSISIHSLLTSPSKPMKLKSNEPDVLEAGGTKVAWMQMNVANLNEKLRVMRCNGAGIRDPGGKFWGCVRSTKYFKSKDR